MSRKMRNPPASLGTLVTRSQLMLLFFVLLIMAWNSIWLSSSGFRKIERQDVLTRVQEQVKAAKAKGEKDKERGEENKCTPVVARLSELERYGVESGRAMSGSQLSDFILKALETVPQGLPLCSLPLHSLAPRYQAALRDGSRDGRWDGDDGAAGERSLQVLREARKRLAAGDVRGADILLQ